MTAHLRAVPVTHPEPSPDEPTPELSTHDRRVLDQLNTLRARHEARELFDHERNGHLRTAMPEPVTLDALLAEPDEPLNERIESLMTVGTRTMIVAQYKSGKTTLVGNLVACLNNGGNLLGRYRVEPVGKTVLIDTELNRNMLRDWYRDFGVTHPGKVEIFPVRGKVATFNLLDPESLNWWAHKLTGADFVILDNLRPVLDALGLDENHDAGRFLVAFDELLDRAGVPEAAVVTHAGHAGERARGDSRLQDWPDQTWKLVRENDDPASPRYFSAYGRDVDEREQRLDYNTATRALSVAGGSRKTAIQDAALDVILDALQAATGPLSGRAIEDHPTLAEHPRTAVRAALKAGISTGQITTHPGPRRSILHSLPTQCASAP
jgi:hypothetical protein